MAENDKVWKLKVDAETNAPVFNEENNPIYIDPDGQEIPLNPPQMYKKIIDLGAENKTHREKYKGVVEKYSIFDGVEDISAYKEEADKALETVKNFNDKDWMKADKVEKLKKEMSDAYDEKLKVINTSFSEKEKDYVGKIGKKDQQIRQLLVSNQFAVSKHFNGDNSVTILRPDIAESYFGKNFKVEYENDNEDKPVVRAYYNDGSIVTSKINPGEPAAFEEAIGLVIDNYPGRDAILRSGEGGSGTTGGKTGKDDGDPNSLKNLKAQYAEAQKNGNTKKMVSLKNRIFQLQQRS